jgi:hypothetical protein
MNQDEQILIFAVIKERITIIAEKLCAFQKYEIYKNLMKEVRLIEGLINKFQNQLRKTVHQKQLQDYISIGNEKQEEFTKGWEKILTDYMDKSSTQMGNVDRENREKYNELVSSMIYQIEGKKMKIPHSMKILEIQEKLVAINERVEEAANFRNELKKLKKLNEDRIKKENDDILETFKKNISKELENITRKEENKIKLGEDKLRIDWNKKSDIQNKQINLHINDIICIQNSLTNMYSDMGSKTDELKRTKERQRNTNKAIRQTKTMKDSSVTVGTDIKQNLAFALFNIPTRNFNLSTSSLDGMSGKSNNVKKSILALKYIVNNFKITRFHIASDFNARKFCNVPDSTIGKNDNNLKKKIKKILDQRKHKDEIIIPPSYFYDENLNVVTDAKDYKHLLPQILKK